MKNLVTNSEFSQIEIRAGIIIYAELNEKLKNSYFFLKIDFGEEIGIKESLAQLTKNYNSEKLLHKQIVAVVNFPKKQIGNFISEVLVLGFPDENGEPILISPDKKVTNGVKLY